MKTVWDYSLNSEARRVIHCGHNMANGFYRINNFHVLPLGTKNVEGSVVLFPDLDYNKIKRFWERCGYSDTRSVPIESDPQFIAEVEQFLKNYKFRAPDYQHQAETWSKAQSEIFKAIYKTIPSLKGKIEKVIIFPTLLGTGASFNLLDENKTIRIYLRNDRDIYAIVESILTSATRRDLENKLCGTWSESEILVDWLLYYSPIAQVLKKYQPNTNFKGTIKATRTIQNAKILKESEDFYRKLGLPARQKTFNINGKIPEFNKKPLINLSAKEKLILKTLIEKSESVVAFDEIADLIFADENKYSLYAVTKTIQRLRDKLERNGVSGSYIQTLRGKGYLLKN